MSEPPNDPDSTTTPLHAEVGDRFGVLPNFFRLAPEAPEVTANLWGFAKFGYLDNPLPPLFKERLFVYLSRFCEVRYCIARHVGFLAGLGRPSGDRHCPPETVEQVVRLIRRTLPRGDDLEPHVALLEAGASPLPHVPESDAPTEEAIFACATHVFLQTPQAARCLEALRRAFDPVTFQHLLVFLAFVRTAHFWTKLHPELRVEDDITELLAVHESLAGCVRDDPEATSCETTQVLLDELAALRRERALREDVERTNAALREERERLRTTLASIGDAVITTGTAGHITNLNAVAESLTGWTNADAVGQPLDAVFKIVNETTRQPVVNPATRALREGVIVGLANHTVLIAKDGTERPIDDSAAPIRCAEGEVVGCVLVFRDVTERRREEAALRESELRYRLVGQAANDAIWDWDLVTNQVTWNEGLRRVFGYTAEQVGLDASWWVEHIHPDDRDRVAHDIHAAIDGDEELWSGEYRYRRADGSYAEVFDRGRVVRDGGRPARMVGSMLDLTERKRAEAALRESEERLRGIFTQTLAGIAETDMTGRFVQVNKRFCEIVGRSADELLGLRMQDITHPDDLPRNLPLFERALADGTPFTIEKRYVRRDGSSVWVSNSVSLVRDERGGPKHVVAASIDITENRRANEALRESEAHFRSMADNAPTMLWVTDPTGSCTYLSKRWFEFTGRAPEQDLGFGWLENVHPDDVPQAKAIFLDANGRHAPFSIDYRLRRHDGEYRWAVDAGLPRFDREGGFQGFVGTVTDTHDRTLGERASQFLAGASAALAELTDPDSTLQKLAGLAVPQFADWCAVDMLDEKGERCRLAVAHHDPAKVLLAKEIEGRYPARPDDPHGVGMVLRTGQPELVEDIPDTTLAALAHDDDHLRLMRELGLGSYICVPIRSHGKTQGGISFVLDRAGRRYTAADLSVAQDLAHRAAVAIDNVGLYRALQEADRRKDEFLAVLAHELRNPLAPIRNALQIMKMSDEREAGEEARTLIERQVGQMVRLVDDLMDVSRISRNRLELIKERVELARVVQSAVETSRPLIEQMGHHLTVKLPPQPVYLDADHTRLAQVFLNLLNNSAKYTEPEGRIWLTAERQGSDVVVSVRDNGIGIPPDKLGSVFELFSQVEGVSSRQQGGLGIGLSLVKRLVEMHGGSIEAESGGPGKGSTFAVRLPVLVQESRPQQQGERREEAAPTSALRILIVDDNRDSADSLSMMLKIMGNDTHTAYDGEEAVAAAGKHRPDVILLDIGLPKLNGYEACRRIREQPGGNELVIIAQTGWGAEEDRQRTHEAGFDRHMVKPVDPTALMKLLAGLSEAARK